MTHALIAYLYIMGLIVSATLINPAGHGFIGKLLLTVGWPVGIPIEIMSYLLSEDEE